MLNHKNQIIRTRNAYEKQQPPNLGWGHAHRRSIIGERLRSSLSPEGGKLHRLFHTSMPNNIHTKLRSIGCPKTGSIWGKYGEEIGDGLGFVGILWGTCWVFVVYYLPNNHHFHTLSSTLALQYRRIIIASLLQNWFSIRRL